MFETSARSDFAQPAIQPRTASAPSRRHLLTGIAGLTTVTGLNALTPLAHAASSSLQTKIHAIDARTTGMLSVAVFDRRSGNTYVYNPTARNECASIVKVLILASVCDRAQGQGRQLKAWEKSQAFVMIRDSDNTAATNLWQLVGGAPAVQDMATRLGMQQTITNTAWGLTTTSALDQVRLMNEICYQGRLLGMSHRRYIVDLMGSVTPSQRWGVGSVGTAQVKNGWLPYEGQWRINSIGHVGGSSRNHTMAILQTTPTMESGTAIADEVALTVFNHLAQPL